MKNVVCFLSRERERERELQNGRNFEEVEKEWRSGERLHEKKEMRMPKMESMQERERGKVLPTHFQPSEQCLVTL